jgi:putative ABC transport system ATP-binding protein
MNSVIEVRDLRFRYPQGPEVLDIPEFEVFEKEKVFLYGPSGCGKTTLLEILAGIHSPSSGTVRILSRDLSIMTNSEKDQLRGHSMGFVFQNFNLIPYLSVQENILLPLQLHEQRRSRVADQDTEVERMLAELGMSHKLRSPVHQLSVGQQQRVALARALIGGPKLVLADEPTSALDVDHREKFLRLLFKLCDESAATLLFVSHDRTLEKIFDRSLSLEKINRLSFGGAV